MLARREEDYVLAAFTMAQFDLMKTRHIILPSTYAICLESVTRFYNEPYNRELLPSVGNETKKSLSGLSFRKKSPEKDSFKKK